MKAQIIKINIEIHNIEIHILETILNKYQL
jgi:hypothetical protein